MIYVNFDLETTGEDPENNAILSIGAVAHESETWKEIGSFSMNLAIPEGRVWDPATKLWWETDPEAGMEKLAQTTANQWSPEWAARSFFEWILHLPSLAPHSLGDRRVAFVSNPIAYDLPYLRSYMRRYVGKAWTDWSKENKAGLGGVDLITLAMCVIGADTRQDTPAYPDARRRMWPEHWSPKNLPHTHIAIDDARHQAYAFICMMRELDEVRGRRPY